MLTGDRPTTIMCQNWAKVDFDLFSPDLMPLWWDFRQFPLQCCICYKSSWGLPTPHCTWESDTFKFKIGFLGMNLMIVVMRLMWHFYYICLDRCRLSYLIPVRKLPSSEGSLHLGLDLWVTDQTYCSCSVTNQTFYRCNKWPMKPFAGTTNNQIKLN